MSDFRLTRRGGPVILSIPHLGTEIPADIAARMTETGRATPDADRHLDRLYEFAEEIDATILQSVWSRYCVDLNRGPDDAHLYPGQVKTGLVPEATFDGAPIYAAAPPDANEIRARVARFWRPYHEALADEIARVKSAHGRVFLWECHSIRRRVPRLFPGALPDFNLGSADGSACPPALAQRLLARASASGFEAVLDARFKGGYITRHYGRPAEGVCAIQMEMPQDLYMDEPPPHAYRGDRAVRVQPTLRALIEDFQQG